MGHINTVEESKQARCPEFRCFANKLGDCTILTETPKNCMACTFYKTSEQRKADADKADQRLMKLYGLTSEQIMKQRKTAEKGVSEND